MSTHRIIFPFFCILLLIITGEVKSQCNTSNLAPNPGFENNDTLQCNLTTNPVTFNNNVHDWNSPTQTTPDLVSNLNSQSCWAHIPHSTFSGSWACNRKGLVSPRNGNFVLSLSTHSSTAACANGAWNEYVQAQLKTPLYPNTTYNVSMFTALTSNSHHATDGLGFHFSDTMINTNNCLPLDLPRHVATNNVLHNDTNWHKISGTFSPNDTMHYVLIGNFDDKHYTNTTVHYHNTSNNDTLCNGTTYLIDDIHVCEQQTVSISCDNGSNFVANPSFENYNQLQCDFTTIPGSFGNNVQAWSSPIETTPDLVSNQNSQSCWAHTPNSTFSGSGACNRKGMVQPRSGNAVGYVAAYSEGAACAQGAWNEYMQSKLKTPLYPSKTYHVSMFAALASNSHHAVDGLGFHFSDTMVNSNSCVPLDIQTHVGANNVLDNDSSWKQISGTFSPNDTIHYVVIGNFDDKFYSNTTVQPHNTQNNDPLCAGASYLIDDISICEKEPVVTCGSESLITNTSFENYSKLPCYNTTSSSEFTNNVQDWTNPNGTTPDLVTDSNHQSCWSHTPNSTFNGSGSCHWNGSVAPKDGKVAVFLQSYSSNAACANGAWTEYIQTELFSPVAPGQLIYAEMYIAHTTNSHHAIDNLGFYFSENQIASNSCTPMDYNAQIKADQVMKNDTAWIKISGSFTATDTINYVTIGNFDDKNYSNTKVQLIDTTSDPLCNGARYLVDDVNVCLGTISGETSPEIKAEKTAKKSVSIYPNPAHNLIHIDGKREDWNSVRIYNTIGEMEMETQFNQQLDISSLAKGMYLIELRGDKSKVTKKIIKR